MTMADTFTEAPVQDAPLTEELQPQETPFGEAPLETAATPSPETISKAEYEALKQQTDALLQWQQQLQTGVQSLAQQQQAAKTREDFQKLNEELAGYGIPEQDRGALVQSVDTMMKIRNPAFQQALQQHAQEYASLERENHALKQLLANLPPNTTLATLRQHLAELSTYETPGEREREARRIAQLQYQNNQRQRVGSGAESIERGGGMGGGVDGLTAYQRMLLQGKAMPPPADIDRLTARYLQIGATQKE